MTSIIQGWAFDKEDYTIAYTRRPSIHTVVRPRPFIRSVDMARLGPIGVVLQKHIRQRGGRERKQTHITYPTSQTAAGSAGRAEEKERTPSDR